MKPITSILSRLREVRSRIGAKWCVVLLTLPPAAFGIYWLGPRAAVVLALSVLLCMAAGILPRMIARQPFELFHPGAIVTGMLLGLTLSVDTPIYMIVVGALVAEYPGKYRLPGLGRNLLNPAALGRTAIALLEWLDPSAYGPPAADIVSGASALFKEAGGNIRPQLADLFVGFHPGAIGETSELLLIPIAVVMLTVVVVKRHAALAMILAVPLTVICLPPAADIVGHAPWALNPLVYLLAGNTLLLATFFATDPVTTPNSRWGAVLFGVGVGVLGVLARLYTSIPGPEMYAVLLMNLMVPLLDRAFLKTPSPVPASAANIPHTAHAADTSSPPPEISQADTALFGSTPRITSTLRLGPFTVFKRLTRRRNTDGAVREIEQSGLRGCGGARFPLHLKWKAFRDQPHPRILIANGQEGEPETFKDRYLMQNYPELVVEGVAIASLLLDVDEILIVVSAHSEPSQEKIRNAVARLRELPESRCLPPIRVLVGSERYICGEESALIEFLETGREEPRLRPPLPIEYGLEGMPTLVHNVETLSWLPSIVHYGAEWFRGNSDGYQLVSLSGAVRQQGVYEVASGTPLWRIIDQGGGLPAGEQLTAIAVGGPSGGLLPPHMAGLAFSPDALRDAGTMMGTGAVRVLGKADSVTRVAQSAAEFFRGESCGRCTSCRVGTWELCRLWEDVVHGNATAETLEQLSEVATVLQRTSTCGLGIASPSRVLSVMRYWPEELGATGESRKETVGCNESP